MPDISLVIDGENQTVPAGTTGTTWFEKSRDVVAIKVDGTPRDLATPFEEGTTVEAITLASEDGLNILRHSATHVLAQAVQDVFPDVNLGIGPFITDGFYYDFGNIDAVTPELLRELEKRMKRIIKEGQRFVRREVSEDEAVVELAEQPYKLELVTTKGKGAEGASVEVGGATLTMYDNVRRDGSVAWKDLCRGPHLPSTKLIGNGFALTKASAAYWKGDQSNDQLQRIYGTAWASKEDLVAYQERIKEAERRDHRRLGAELDLYSFPEEIGPGLVVFHPKGGILRHEIESYVTDRHKLAGFDFVHTPEISKGGLFHTSGHLPYYADTMFPPMLVDEERDEDGNVSFDYAGCLECGTCRIACEGTIVSIDDYPTSNGNNWGDGNSNVSYYPFKVFVTEDANLQPNDYVDIQYQKDTSAEESGSSLYLQSMFIRTDNGKSYVMARGEDGRLEQRWVQTGRDLWGSYTQIRGGLTIDDYVAFPYGRDVVEGAHTQEATTDQLYNYGI